jgi:Ca2+-binding EF-hand superfamily protein
MAALVKMCDNKDIDNLRIQFEKIDTDHSGSISSDELINALMDLGRVSINEVDKIIENVDYDKNGLINYTEFLSATLNTKNFLTEEVMQTLFDHYDVNRRGYLLRGDIKAAFTRAGKECTDQEIDQIFRDHDVDKNGQISFNEFCLMFKMM